MYANFVLAMSTLATHVALESRNSREKPGKRLVARCNRCETLARNYLLYIKRHIIEWPGAIPVLDQI